MAKYDTDDVGKPGKPPKYRRFPWRLWLLALAATAGSAYGGYYWWQHRKDTEAADEAVKACRADLAKVQPQVDEANKKYAGCNTLLEANNKKIQDLSSSARERDIQMTALSNNLSASKEELTALIAQRAEAEKRLAAIAEIQKQFAKMIDTGQLKVNARRGSLVLSLPSEVLFPSGVADLSKPGEMAVLEVGFALKKFPERRFLVIGHTDDQPLKGSTYKDNWELSTARALAVARFFVQAGMDPKNLLASGAGENDPIGKDRAKNARIEIVLLPAIQDLPALPASLGADTAKSELPKLEATKPEAPKPDAAKPAPPKPEAPKPDAAKPDAAKPDPAKPAAKP